MQIAVITGPTHEIALRRIALANRVKDGLELRLDLFKDLCDLEKVRLLLQNANKKVILTLRKKGHGGGFVGAEKRRLDLIMDLCASSPDYIDIECDTDPDFIASIRDAYPDCKIISSLHNFLLTPRDLEKTFKSMESRHVYAYKMCTTANSLADAYKMLRFIQKKTTAGIRFIGICMGDYGRITRREGTRAGNYLNYTILHNRDRCAPGLDLA